MTNVRNVESLRLRSAQKAGVQRAAALCRGRGGVPRKFFFRRLRRRVMSGNQLKEVNVSEGVPTLSISLHDIEKLQALYPDYQIELREGKIIIIGPSDSASGEIGARFSTLLGTWVYSHNLGRVLDASTGFRMPSGDLLSPDVSFVS